MARFFYLKTNSKYKIGKNTYETDAQGRVTGAKGELDLQTAERNNYQQRKGVTSKDGDVTTDQGGI
ncbi:DNA/RNA non-specific endonuclease [Runella sp.]|uniref:DNA/RNA non-specific endonuclease n=1 Tax=Runella sp. TaxID=1960881 RepID=UPI003D0A721F